MGRDTGPIKDTCSDTARSTTTNHSQTLRTLPPSKNSKVCQMSIESVFMNRVSQPFSLIRCDIWTRVRQILQTPAGVSRIRGYVGKKTKRKRKVVMPLRWQKDFRWMVQQGLWLRRYDEFDFWRYQNWLGHFVLPGFSTQVTTDSVSCWLTGSGQVFID
jgi:hypothetical protein